ncbi:hypothetical protein [Streptomyces sp. NPDC058371]|uniref:hypothetical protein n=1 Tax=Streptomyces sp. NPDC058371 TaxID=3346463 RepID=UPI003659031E
MNNDLLSRLAALDAAPRTEPSAAELDREEQLLRTVLSDTEQPSRPVLTSFRRPLVRRAAFTVVGVLAAGAALVTVTADPPKPGGSGPLSSAQVATWTGTPGALTDAGNVQHSPLVWCVRATKEASGEGGPGTLSNADSRGTIASMIITRHERTMYCLAGSDGSGVTIPIDPVAKVDVAADGITLDARGAVGSGSARFSYAVGSMGADVEAITVYDHGRTVHATVRQIRSLPYGRWTAWWPSEGSPTAQSSTLTITFSDGTTRTVSADSLKQ